MLNSDMINSIMLENQILKHKLNLYDIDMIVKKITSIIIEAAHKAIGKTILYLEKIHVPWWFNECRNAIKK